MITRDKQDCQNHKPMVITNQTGYLASITSVETGCGTSDAPWLIEALPGQRINVTLVDFAPEGSTVVSGPTDGLTRICRVYATIREGSGKRSITICGGESRLKSVHVSLENAIEIRIINNYHPPKPINFLLKFEGVLLQNCVCP